MRGVLLVSIGHHTYARWAHNMAVSIRAVSPDLCIHVATDGNFPVDPLHLSVVDKVIQMDPKDYQENGKLMPAKAKLGMYKYSEFDETIYLDVDGCVIKDITPLFDECKHKYYQCQVNGISTKEHDNLDASLWVKPKQVWDKFKLKEDAILPGTNSSFQYFKKTKAAETLFKKARTNLDKKRFGLNELRYTWGKSKTQPDELYMNIALAQTDHLPDVKPVLYLRKRGAGRHVGLGAIKEKYYVIGCWGDTSYNHMEISGTGRRETGLYNKVMINAFREVYGERVKFNDHFHSLIKHKVYARPIT